MIECRHSAFNRLHTEPAVVKVSLTEGCVCFPDDKEQWLCEHHLNRLAENGVIETYEIIEYAR